MVKRIRAGAPLAQCPTGSAGALARKEREARKVFTTRRH